MGEYTAKYSYHNLYLSKLFMEEIVIPRVHPWIKTLSMDEKCIHGKNNTVSAQIEHRRSINFYKFQAAHYGHF